MPTMNRRAILAGTAAAIATPAAALPPNTRHAAPDPIFVAIQTYRAADAAFLARCYHEDDLTKKGIQLALAPDDHRTPEMVRLVDASIAAREQLASTAPTTLAGVLAVLRFVREQSQEGGEFLFTTDEEATRFTADSNRVRLQ